MTEKQMWFMKMLNDELFGKNDDFVKWAEELGLIGKRKDGQYVSFITGLTDVINELTGQFANIVWSEEDIASVCKEHDITITDRIIGNVKSNEEVIKNAMLEAGWEALEYLVKEAQNEEDEITVPTSNDFFE
jgi:hypothetical protein